MLSILLEVQSWIQAGLTQGTYLRSSPASIWMSSCILTSKSSQMRCTILQEAAGRMQ